MTQADIITRVKERLDEDATTSQRYTDADITEYTLDGARYYIAKTGCQYAQTTITTTAYTQLYDLPCDFIQIERVLWNNDGEYRPIDATQPRTLDMTVYQWERKTDVRARAYYVVAPRRIGLWPLSTAGGEEYIVHYQQDVPSSLSSVPVEDHEALVEYVVSRLLLAEGKSDLGVEGYTKFIKAVTAATRRRSSHDRLWSMSARG